MIEAQLESEKKNWVLVKCVEKWAQEYNENSYIECCSTFCPNSITNGFDIKVIRRFLYSWGRMGRVLGQEKYSDWEKRIEKLINSKCVELDELRKTDLMQVSLEGFEKKIEELYRSFDEILGPIAAVKTMHLVCPKFFPLWDNPIASAFRKERVTTEKTLDFSAEDYYGFMKDIKALTEEYRSSILMLSSKYDVGELRVIDQFAWWISHRPLSLLH